MKLFYILCITSSLLYSQISVGGTPISFKKTLSALLETVTMESVDVQSLLEEDKLSGKDVPFRFGHGTEVSFDLISSGTWEKLSNGDRVWRLAVKSSGAFSINIIYDDFFMPPGGKFFVYSENKSYVIGAFTEENNKADGIFATQPVPGDHIILEYIEPSDVVGLGRIQLSRVIHGYRNLFGFKDTRGYGDSGSCNNNVNCPEGMLWQDHNRAVAMILTSGGSRICTGALVNNVQQDQTQYFLTADHCLGGNNNWIFMFNYESPGCANQDGPTNQTVQGSVLRASRSTSDFALLELTETIPSLYNVNYAGWSAVDVPPQEPVGIHHPSGDIKKISFDYDVGISDGWSGNDGSHWRVSSWEDGTTEPGSSGSPLFDNNYRIVGQLHGGQASCSFNFNDYYGKFSASWDWGGSSSNQLKNWLDPENTGTLVLDSYDTGSAGELSYTPDVIHFEMSVNETDVQDLLLTNVGEPESILNYQIGVSSFSDIGGGPDQEGMTWTDSDLEINLDYEWIEISVDDNIIAFSHNDDAEGPFDIGFDFPFYGQNYDQYIINPNGWIGFGNDINSWDNSTIPSSGAPRPAIFGFWDDLNPVNDNCNEYCAGNIYMHSDAQRSVVSFDGVAHWWSGYPNSYYDFQIVLYPSGEIQLNYKSITGTHSATIGMQNGSGSTGLQVSFNDEYVHDELSVKFSKGPEWFTVSPMEGELGYGMSDNISVIVSTEDMSPGEYECYISITSNGGNGNIPVILTLGSGSVTINQDYFLGWNLVGLPVVSESSFYIDLFPGAIQNTLFSYISGAGYQQTENLELGKGYWLRISQNNTATFTGNPVDELTVQLIEGWNLISGISYSISPETILDPEGIIVPNTVYGYGQGYFQPQYIEPAKAYWLRSSGDGEIIMSSSSTVANQKTFQVSNNLNTISLNNTLLYFGGGVSEKEIFSYSLPPKPPFGSNDIRFLGDSKLCTTDDCVIDIMQLPGGSLTFDCNIKGDEKWEIVDKSGNVYPCENVSRLEVEDELTSLVLRKKPSNQIPSELVISPAFPNPFNPVTMIQLSLSELSVVNVSVFNIQGKLIETLLNQEMSSGQHMLKWDAWENPSGIYFLQLSTEKRKETQKLVLMK
ncbi:MAG: hypothetical protein CMG69_02025 [Candidatus Marinimicrobia bacterium]|nr:hypothetical protein [Candidatus Neomarinimicrobiota bacterium]|tara:strand:+ start:131136 stop:134465 length:3330 start_codon:yes stop_codon:yes gene_type:complete